MSSKRRSAIRERMRNIQRVDRQFYLFHALTEGCPYDLETRLCETLCARNCCPHTDIAHCPLHVNPDTKFL